MDELTKRADIPATAPLFETYRPATWSDVVGQEKAAAVVARLRDRGGLAGRAYWIQGASGTGKTTVARLLAHEVAGDSRQVVELDASDLTPARLREIEDEARCRPLFGAQGWAYVVNEAHGLRTDTVRQLLVWLERLPRHAVVIFTTTVEGQASFEGMDDAAPLLSRCLRLPLARRGLAEAMAERARAIAEAEGLAGVTDPKRWLRLVQDHRNNLRAVLQAVEAGEML